MCQLEDFVFQSGLNFANFKLYKCVIYAHQFCKTELNLEKFEWCLISPDQQPLLYTDQPDQAGFDFMNPCFLLFCTRIFRFSEFILCGIEE